MSKKRKTCPLCGTRLRPSNRTKDHFIARSRGGTSDPSNTWPMCRRCNEKKGNRDPTPREAALFAAYKGLPPPDKTPL